MGINLKVFRITDYAMVLRILLDPVISDNIYEDGASLSVPDVVNEYWLGIEKDGEVIGCYRLTSFTGAACIVHAFILPKFRKNYSVQAAYEATQWAFDNIRNLNTIIAHVPVVHRNVIWYIESLNWEKIGVIKESFRRDGALVDQALYQITKEKFKEAR